MNAGGCCNADGDSGLLQPGCDLPVPGDRDEVDAIERTRLADVAHHLAGEVDTSAAVLVEGVYKWVGTASSGICEESLRAIVADGGAMTPAKTGPSKWMVPRHLSKASSEKFTCTKRKSASRFQSGKVASLDVTPMRKRFVVLAVSDENRRASSIMERTVRSSDRRPVSGRSPYTNSNSSTP
ncbi:MAG: hypothetical protein ACRD03_16075 [Acidimicrobiales bacterium]